MKKVLLSLLLAIACMPMAIGQNKAGNLVTIDTTVCSSFTWIDGFTYTHDTVALYTSASDSTVYVLNLTMSGAVTDTANAIELDGICSVNWNNKVWSTPGSFFDTLSTVSGCDSIVKLQITLAGESHDTIVAQACDEYVFDSVSYTASGNYTITETEGTCHTYTHLFLTIANTLTDTASVVVRDTIGGCSITWDGQTYSFADTNRTIYALGTTSVAGCDSLMAIRITGFTGTQRDTNYVENCGYYLWEGDTLRTSGIYTTVDTTATCIEVNNLALTITSLHDTTTTEVCETYTFIFSSREGVAGARDRATFTESGIYNTDLEGDTLYSTHFRTGCVTYHTLDLTVIPVAQRFSTETIYDTVCDKYTISFGGESREFTESTGDTTLLHSRRTVRNCYDTSITLNIIVNHRSYADYNETVCDSYFWPFTGQTYTSSTVQTYILPDTLNSVKCDSVGRLNLTVNYTPEVSIEGNWHLNPEVSSSTVLRIVDNPADHNTYKWFKNNEATPFSTADSVTVTVTDNTDIHLQSTSNKGCTADNWLTITLNVGIDDVDGLNVNLYPNPTSRYLNVESAEGISTVVVYNTIGQQVIRRDINATAAQLDLGNLAVGTYTLQILSANGEQATRKFIVNK